MTSPTPTQSPAIAMPEERHHPFCNYFGNPREGCRQCEHMFKHYPLQDGETPFELVARHFPNAKPRI